MFVPIKAVATRLAVSVKTLRRWGRNGEMTMCKIGNRWKVPEREIDDYIARKTHTPVPRAPATPMSGQLELPVTGAPAAPAAT